MKSVSYNQIYYVMLEAIRVATEILGDNEECETVKKSYITQGLNEPPWLYEERVRITQTSHRAIRCNTIYCMVRDGMTEADIRPAMLAVNEAKRWIVPMIQRKIHQGEIR